MRETPQVSIVPTDDVYRCSILLKIAKTFAINRRRSRRRD